jgi:hypothetical protein
MTSRNRKPQSLPWAKDYNVNEWAAPGGTRHPWRLMVDPSQPLTPPRVEAVTMGGDSPRRGPRDPKAWAVWYTAEETYPWRTASGWDRQVSLGPSRAERHAAILKAELPPVKYFTEIGKQLRAARRG